MGYITNEVIVAEFKELQGGSNMIGTE